MKMDEEEDDRPYFFANTDGVCSWIRESRQDRKDLIVEVPKPRQYYYSCALAPSA